MAVVYFELGWSILSTICLANVLFGLLVVNILGLTPVSIIPIIVSAAGAVANGLCYYVFYANYPTVNTAVASVFADILWMVQEAGNSFYSYAILSRIIFDRELLIFKTLFWSFILSTVVTRILIAAHRARSILDSSLALQRTVNGLHVGYFTSLALLECVCAFFLIHKFASVYKISRQASLQGNVFRHLMRNSEIRVATLALMGLTRAITYYFQPSFQKASSIPSQVDRFVYTLECLFPVIMFIDMMASKIASVNSTNTAHTFPGQPCERFIESAHTQSGERRISSERGMVSPFPQTPPLDVFPMDSIHAVRPEMPSKARLSGVSDATSSQIRYEHYDLTRRISS